MLAVFATFPSLRFTSSETKKDLVAFSLRWSIGAAVFDENARERIFLVHVGLLACPGG